MIGSNPPLDGWHILLVPQGNVPVLDRIKTHTWIISVTEEFMRGYDDNPKHGDTFLAVGTSNSNVAWACDKDGETSDLWHEAGKQWGDMVEHICVPGSKISLHGANDVESWAGDEFTYDDGTPWYACGTGTVNWFTGYEEATSGEIIPVRNFGSNVYHELPAYWSIEQAYNVFAGLTATRFHPQVYCPGGASSLADVAATATSEPDLGRIFFYGVTSENNGNDTCGDGAGSLTWEQSWVELRDALMEKGFYTTLSRAVSSFCIEPQDTDKQCRRYGESTHTQR